MAKFLIGVLVGIIVAVLGIVVVGFAIGRIFATRQPTIPADSVLILSLSGDLPEKAPIEIPLPFFQSTATPTVRDIWASLRYAATDNRIKAVLIQPYRLVAGWGKIEEIRQDLANFKKSGKPVYALLQAPGSREYYLASVADKIYLSPDDVLNVKGFRIAELYFKNALDKLGISVEVDHIGRYKDAGDIFTRTSMSPETREVLDRVVDQIYNSFSSTVAQSRHESLDAIRALIDQGPFLAGHAKTAGLIDETGYEDQVFDNLKRVTRISNLNQVSITTYFRGISEMGDRIALLVGEGDIIRSENEPGLESEAVIASEPFIKTIRQVRADNSIKGVILRINSPGGDATASDQILRELKLLSKVKPLVISMSDVAASGGYYIAATGDPIVAYPDTITGSIGVLYVKPNIHGLFDKLGITEDAVSRGRNADIDSLYAPMSDVARSKLHESIQEVYQQFVSSVADARKKSFAQIDNIAQGRVWMGAQAEQNGLVDRLGGLDEAISLIRQRAHLPPSGAIHLVPYPPRRSLVEWLTGSSLAPDLEEDEATTMRILRKKIPDLPGPAWMQGGILRIMPYQLCVQ
jgi:protease-4